MKKLGLVLVLLGVLSGCATTSKPVSLAPEFWENKQQSLGVAVAKRELPDATMTGSQGLLDYAINRGNAKQLIEFLNKLELSNLDKLPDSFLEQLNARGFSAKKIDTPIDVVKLSKASQKSTDTKQYAEYDFGQYKNAGIDRLLLITVERVGTTRNYYGFMPTNPPQADLSIKGQLIDLNTHELLWNTSVVQNSPIPEPWDQPTTFENVGGAVKKNLDQGVEKFEQSFFAGPVKQ